jgi:hypothetical protein
MGHARSHGLGPCPPDGELLGTTDGAISDRIRPQAAERFVTRAGVAPGELVVNIGAGSGTLCQALVGRGAEVVAIEVDPFWAARLHLLHCGRSPGQRGQARPGFSGGGPSYGSETAARGSSDRRWSRRSQRRSGERPPRPAGPGRSPRWHLRGRQPTWTGNAPPGGGATTPRPRSLGRLTPRCAQFWPPTGERNAGTRPRAQSGYPPVRAWSGDHPLGEPREKLAIARLPFWLFPHCPVMGSRPNGAISGLTRTSK